MQNVGLQPVQQIVARRLDEAVPLGARPGVQQINEIPPLLAQRSQQRMADRQIGFVGIDLLSQPGQIAFGLDVAPILLTGIEQEQMNVNVARQGRQQRDIQRRQGGDADDTDPFRQLAAVEVAAGQPRVEPRLRPHPMRLAAARQPPPQFRLPVILLARFPARDPVGPVDQILVEAVGDAAGQFVAAEFVAAIAQIGPHRREAGRLVQIP